MSYSVQTQCWACAFGGRGDKTCKDEIKIQAGVNTLYEKPEEHKGAGMIMVQCCRMEQIKTGAAD